MSVISKALGWKRALGLARRLWVPDGPPPDLEAELAELRAKVPTPVFWLFGKTQSGKTSLVRYLTGAEDAAIGNGFRPCTHTSRSFPFPTADVPVLTFLDTRGVDEPGYDPAEDIAAFDARAHLMVVTNRLTDFTHGHMRAALRKVRDANRTRPVILALTCLHHVRPQDQHPQPYPFDPLGGNFVGQVSNLPSDPHRQVGNLPHEIPDDWVRLVKEQAALFDGLVDRIVPIDLTRPEEGYADTAYGGEALKAVLLDSLPGAYRTTFARLTEVTDSLKDLHLKHAMPVILGYSSLAASAGAVPVPFLDLLLIPAIQARMVHALGTVYGQEMTAVRFLETAASLGLGLAARQAVRELVKFIPVVGSAAGAALAWASTYALGRAFCEYYTAVHDGHVPTAAALKKLYQDQLAAAEKAWAKP